MPLYYAMKHCCCPYFIPFPEVENVNITMGFPLAQTPVYSYISALMELQTTGYRRDTGRYTYEAVLAILKHPYTRQLSAAADDLEQQLTKDNRFYPPVGT